MMPFFLTMPMSRMMPISAITDKSIWNVNSTNNDPTPAENDVDGHQSRQDQIGLALERTLKSLCGSLKGAGDGGRKAHLRRFPVDRVHCLTQRRSWSEVERQRHGGE